MRRKTAMRKKESEEEEKKMKPAEETERQKTVHQAACSSFRRGANRVGHRDHHQHFYLRTRALYIVVILFRCSINIRQNRQTLYPILECIQHCRVLYRNAAVEMPRVDSSASLLRVSNWGIGTLTRLVIPEHTKQIETYVVSIEEQKKKSQTRFD